MMAFISGTSRREFKKIALVKGRDEDVATHQRRVVRTLASVQVFYGIGSAGIVAAGSLLAASI